jgi:cyclase
MRKMVALLVFTSTLAFAQMDFSKMDVKVIKVAGNIYMVDATSPGGGFSGGNIGVSVGDDGIVMVDDKFAPLGPKIEAALKEITDKPIRFILNTHVHADHTHGNVYFGKKTTVIAHENVYKRLGGYKDFGGSNSLPPPEAYPIITFDSSVTIHLNGEDVRGLHIAAGHTDGDTVVFFAKSNVVHMGDDFFNGMFPFIDLETGGSVPGYIAASRSRSTRDGRRSAREPEDAEGNSGHPSEGD